MTGGFREIAGDTLVFAQDKLTFVNFSKSPEKFVVITTDGKKKFWFRRVSLMYI